MNFAAMAEMYNSVQWARHVDGEIEKVITQISEAWREAAGVSTRDLVLALVFMVGGELIAPIIAGARLAVAALRASTSTIRASEEVSILAREIEAGAAGDATAASQVTKSSAWKDSAVGRAITKVKDTLDKSINKVSICAWGSAAWQAGDLVSGQVLTRRDVGKSLYRPVLLPPSFNLSISKWLDDIHDDEHFLDLEERDLGGRVANSWSIVGKSDVPVKQQKKSFYKSGRNRNGFTYMQEGWFQGSRPGATVSFPSPTGVVDEPVADVVKRITGMDVEHALEKAPYFDNTITPISEAYKGANPAVKKEIEAALSGEHEMLVGKENVKISINDHFVDLIHGPGNVYICEHGTNMAKTAFYQLKGLSDRYRHFATLFALLETWTGKRINARDMAIAGLDRRQQLTEELIKRLRSRKTIPTQLIDDLGKFNQARTQAGSRDTDSS
ncbi:hypothetical protein HDU90_006955 [Geranomyces variabilis]|nr:hypothetical protein HDU90_006955 [Geranomyces variabilis]